MKRQVFRPHNETALSRISLQASLIIYMKSQLIESLYSVSLKSSFLSVERCVFGTGPVSNVISEMITQTQTVHDVLKGDWVETLTMGPRDTSTLCRYCEIEN